MDVQSDNPWYLSFSVESECLFPFS